MSLPTTGPISLGQVRTELNKTGSISLGSTDVRNLAGKTSGIIKMSDLRGKSYGVINFETEIIVGNDPHDNGGHYFQSWGARSDSKSDYVGGKIINPKIKDGLYLGMVCLWYNDYHMVQLWLTNDLSVAMPWIDTTELNKYKSFKYIIDDKYIFDATGGVQVWFQQHFVDATVTKNAFNYLKSKYKQKVKIRIEAIP